MVKPERGIYIPPKRGRLPWRYEMLDKPRRGDRWVLTMLGLVLASWGMVFGIVWFFRR